MATRRNVKDTEITDINITEEVKVEKAVDKDIVMLELLSKLIDKIDDMGNKSTNSNVEKMNRFCTIVHLQECLEGLETTISVNGQIQYFKNFGETRVYTYSDMQNIVTRYRPYFDRGIFTLGEDCQDLATDFGVKIISGLGDSKYFKSLVNMDDKNFEQEYIKMDDIKKRNYIKMFVVNHHKGVDKYDDTLKIAIINKHSNNILKSLEK